MDAPVIDQAKLEAFADARRRRPRPAYTGVMVSLGSKLGLYKAMACAGPLSAKEVAARAGCAERYVREWLNSQAAGGYLVYHAVSDTYELTPEQAMVLADEESPAYIPPAWNVPAAMWADETKALEAFRTGRGVAWGEHDARLACGVAAFYRNGYRANLVPQWLPALDGVVEQSKAGIDGRRRRLRPRALDRADGRGLPELALLRLRHARATRSTRRGATRPMRASASARTSRWRGPRSTQTNSYGLVCFFDTLHDLGDPVAAARHAAEVLAPGGTVLLVEPLRNDRVEDNLSPVAQLYYAGSTMICCAHAISEGGKLVLGAQAGPRRLAEVFRKAGFTHFRRAAETPFNLIFEVRR